ncbi:hypothetical protein M0Q97_09930 [Candidatus Dojkabacteria bacterium]|jgi:hypothetical protein|nr:hypothetical protein [Candidatus Dojkabacteria bacterium]
MKKSFSIKTLSIIVIVVCLFFLSSCAQREFVESCLNGHQYGFWEGLWHGLIAPIDFIVSLFNHKITMYAQNNNGNWYAFGFLLGSGGWGFIGGKSS